MPDQVESTESTQRLTMTWRVINELEAAGDIATLAEALRNLIVVTDHATDAAQAAATARQEYVPTTLFKDDLYRAMDTALRGEPYEPYGRVLVADEDEGYEPENTSNPALARALFTADEQWNRYAESDGFDEDTDYFGWVADMAQSIVDADERARNRPVELRGEATETAKEA